MIDLVCIICHELLDENSDVYATLCGHIFHNSCISQWFRDSSTCPQCRKPCTNSSLFKIYLDAASETSLNTGVQLSTNNSAIDLYEEVNLNLKRDLELSESNLALYQSKLIELENLQAQVHNELQEEIKKREAFEKRVTELERDKKRLIELDQSLQEEYIRVQHDLRKEIEQKTITNKEIDDLKKDKLHLKTIVHRLELEGVEKNLVTQSKAKGTTEERMAELEKRLEREIEARQKREKQPVGQKDQRMDSITGAILFGVPRLPKENLKSIFQKICEVISCEVPNLIDIYRSRQKNNNDSLIMLKFVSPNERNGLLTAFAIHQKKIKRKLTLHDLGISGILNQNIYIRETLTPQNRVLLQQAVRMKHNNQLASVYTNFGAVYVKEKPNEKAKRINSLQMLNAIVSKKNAPGLLERAASSCSFLGQSFLSLDDLDSLFDFDF